jgi:hypothetical protein
MSSFASARTGDVATGSNRNGRAAIDIAATRLEYLGKGYFVRVVDENGDEVHRESIDSAEKSG